MEFICVLSVGGSLASYHVKQENGESYKASLRAVPGKRDDLPAEILLQRGKEGWQAQYGQEEVVRGIISAIEAKPR